MHKLRLASSVLGLGLILAACSGGGAATSPTAAPTAAPPSAEPSAPASEAPASEAPVSASPAAAAGTVNLGDTSLGSILVDAEGMTLYIFTNDTGGTSSCYDDCASAWPPLLSTADPVAGEGVDATKLGTTERTDGAMQVTYAGMPLYTFASDTAAGDTTGQGVGTKWYVVDAAGTVIK
jgi:predicted lipoprotein with Yx(FWY)xxD motif